MSYVSSELTARLRSQQGDLRCAILELERTLDARAAPALVGQIRALLDAFRCHEGLVNALIEAVEPDQPACVQEAWPEADLEFDVIGGGDDP